MGLRLGLPSCENHPNIPDVVLGVVVCFVCVIVAVGVVVGDTCRCLSTVLLVGRILSSTPRREKIKSDIPTATTSIKNAARTLLN